ARKPRDAREARYRMDRQLCRGGSPDDRPLVARTANDRPDQRRHRRTGPEGNLRMARPARNRPTRRRQSMTALDSRFEGEALAGTAFPEDSRQRFAANYPETPHLLHHDLRAHPLLALDALAELGEALPASSIEYNKGALPIGVDGKPGNNGLTIGETIRNV